jgi:membrane-bound lytic murein transglycosylase B
LRKVCDARNATNADRREFLYALGLTLLAPAAQGQDAQFQNFLQSLRPQALAVGVSGELFDSVVVDLTPEPSVLSRPKAQGEFTIPVPAYLATVATPGRVSGGRAFSSRLSGVLPRIESRSGVPSEIITAILGVESAYGGGTGAADTLRVLATLAYKGERGATFKEEFVAALILLQNGYVRRERLKGSWAGATGQPQFLPSAYLKYAVSASGDGPADIWGSSADAAASVANFLSKSGWVAGMPWGVEVVTPKDFDYADFDLDLAQWRRLGFSRADGEALPTQGPASLYLPTGAKGPAFLITDNFEVIRQYNISDSYALAVGVLADRIAGRTTPRTPWPKVAALSTAQVRILQTALTQRGFYSGVIDGKLGRASRNALHAFQKSAGLQPADGFATQEIVAKLRNE